MSMNLLSLPADEAERIAYAEGSTMTAELFSRIAELETVGREMAIVLAESAAKESEAAIYWASRDVQTVNRRGV